MAPARETRGRTLTPAARSRAEIEIANQDGTLVAVGQHLLKWVANPPTVPPHPPSELAR